MELARLLLGLLLPWLAAWSWVAALEQRHANGPRRKLVTLEVMSRDAPAHPGASVMRDGQVVGTVTSGGWGHRVGRNLAYAFVDPELAADGTEMSIDIIGTLTPARVIPPCPYDPEYARIRGNLT